MSRYWSDIVHTLTPYVPGEQPKIASATYVWRSESSVANTLPRTRPSSK